MKTAVVTFSSVSPYSQSRHYDVPKLNKEGVKDYEARTWRERLHVTDDGTVFIPPMAFKNCVTEAAQYLGIQIPGKGKSTYTKKFTAGLLVTDGLTLKIKKNDVPGEWLFLPSDGKRGGGTRVDKCMPVIQQWGGDVTFYVLDETITEQVLTEHLREAGKFIGLGRFRPIKNGFYGRFNVDKVRWADA